MHLRPRAQEEPETFKGIRTAREAGLWGAMGNVAQRGWAGRDISTNSVPVRTMAPYNVPLLRP